MGYFQLLPLELRNKMEHENELKMCEKTWDFETACCIHTVYRLYSKTIATLLNFLEFLISSWLVWAETELLCLNIPLTSLNHFRKADNRHKKSENLQYDTLGCWDEQLIDKTSNVSSTYVSFFS